MEEKKGFFKRLVSGLTKTRDNIVSGMDSIFHGFSRIDDDFYEELSLELDEEKKDILFDLIKKEAQFAGYSSQGKFSPIMQEDDVYSVIITGDDYFSLLYLSKNPEKTVICANNRYIKLGTMRQTKSFLQKLFD